MIEAPGTRGALTEAPAGFDDAGLISDAVVARSEADRKAFWALRESVSKHDRHFPQTVGFDISIPLGRMGAAVALLREGFAAALPGQPWVVFGHLADSSIHVKMTPAPSIPDARPRIGTIVHGVVGDLSGSVSAEHGIGRLEAAHLGLSRTLEQIELMRGIKRLFDPNSILSPGRVLAGLSQP